MGISHIRFLSLFRSSSPILSALLLFLLAAVPGLAQQESRVQELSGRVRQGDSVWYTIPNLKQGQVLYAHAGNVTANLDPLLVLVAPGTDLQEAAAAYDEQLQAALSEGEDPLVAIPRILGDLAVAWDDDGGDGYDAALQFRIPADGDYFLLVGSSPLTESFGEYRLLLGLDARQVLTGEARPTGDTIATRNRSTSDPSVAVQERTGTLSALDRRTFFELRDITPGDTLYAYVETVSGSLEPILYLEDFGGKLLRTGNFEGGEKSASFQYAFPEGGTNYRLVLESCCGDQAITTGEYRLLVGLNAPDVLDGIATPGGVRILAAPIPVRVGVRIDQITNVDQVAENFSIVADMRAEWTDPEMAFSPDSCDCRFQTMRGDKAITDYLERNGITVWPAISLFNQQGPRSTQNQLLVVEPDGSALYFERFSATLQAPDFNFTLFPFDKQRFYVRLVSVFPEQYYQLQVLPDFSGMGGQLGEEEWVVTNFGTEVDTVTRDFPTSRFSFGFEAVRHINYYIFRLLVPILIIILVSWVTFFLKNYSKRIDVASANLLLFIAYSWTVSGDLPRLGYLTLMDTVLISTFIVTALVIVFNVWLRWLEVRERESVAHKIDNYMIWLYPLAYVAAFAVVWLTFGGSTSLLDRLTL